jgi:large-conductance mechanosensitive channel
MLFGNGNNLEDLKKFVLENGIVGTAAGVTVGIATKDLILSLSGDIIMPSIILLLQTMRLKSLKNYLPATKSSLDFQSFFKNVISWILILLLSYVFVKVTFHYLFGIQKKQDVVKDDKKDDKKEKK